MDRTASNGQDSDDLVSMLEVIEGQPLAGRAAAYESVHDSLARRLESGPAATSLS